MQLAGIPIGDGAQIEEVAEATRYNQGFLHEKAILVDDYGGVGTANFDNRCFRLNFEITLLFAGPSALRQMEAMFADDFARSTRTAATDFTT